MLNGQSDQDSVDIILQLPTAEVRSSSIQQIGAGELSAQWTRRNLRERSGQNLADLLAEESGAFIKSYGNGSLATISLRGGNAGQTSVLWNGLPIQSPMLGLLDIAILPLGFADEVVLKYGGNSSGWGSGAVSGTVNLNNRWNIENGRELILDQQFGSFGQQQQQVQLILNRQKIGSSTRIFRQVAENDFPYQIRADLPTKRQTNAALDQIGFLQELYLKPATNQELSLTVWGQSVDRQIPPTSTQSRSVAQQADDFLRTAINWKCINNQIIWNTKLGWFTERIRYQDTLQLIDSDNNFQVLTAQTTAEYTSNNTPKKPQHRLQGGLNFTYFIAEADAYEQSHMQHRVALFTAYRREWNNWQLQFNARQEMVDGEFIPIVPALGIEKKWWQWILKAKISRNYRLPTLNDLYWQPGGNPDLRPESGWSQELTVGYEKAKQWRYFSTVFNRNINNWILWAVPEGQSFYAPQNLAKVWSRGVEQRAAWQGDLGDWKLEINGGYNFVLSTNEVAIDNPKIAAGEQLVYVPEHTAFGKVSVRWKNWQWIYHHRYVSTVATLLNTTLEDYQLGGTRLAYGWNKKRWEGHIYLNVNNLYDKTYRVIERRPMPGRNFSIGVRLNFRKKMTNYCRSPIN